VINKVLQFSLTLFFLLLFSNISYANSTASPATTATSAASQGVSVNLIVVNPIRTQVFQTSGGRSTYGTENFGSLGTVLPAPSGTTSTTQSYAHFFDTNYTGWVNNSNIVTLAKTSSELAAYAFITYVNPALNLTPVVIENQSLTLAQQTALKAAETALTGKQYFVFGGKVIVLDGNTSINVNDVNDKVTMVVKKGTQSYGTALWADLSQVDVVNTCDSSGSWYNYVYCLLDNRAKTVTASSGTLNLNTDTVTNTITAYLNTTYASIGGVAHNFTISISPSGQGVDIKPSNPSSLGIADQVTVSFFNDPSVYDKTNIVNSFNQIVTDINSNNPTIAFYVIADGMTDALSYDDFAQIFSPQGSSQSPQAKAMVQSAAKSSSVSSTPVTPAQCYAAQSNAVNLLPCNNEIDAFWGVTSNGGGIINLPSGSSQESTLMNGLNPLGYKVITHRASPTASDYGVGFLKDLIESKGQILVMDFHGTEDGKVGSFGCVNTYDTDNGVALKNLASALHALYVAGDIKNGYDPQRLDGYLNQGDNFALLIPTYEIAGVPGSQRYCPTGQDGWGLNLNVTNIGVKAIEISQACFGQAGALKNALNVLAVPSYTEGRNDIFVDDLRILVNQLNGRGPILTYFNGYPPGFDTANNAYLNDVNVNSILNLSNTWTANNNKGDLSEIPVSIKGPYSKCNIPVYSSGSGPQGITVPAGGVLSAQGKQLVVPYSCLLTPFLGNTTQFVHLFPYVNGFSFSSPSSGISQVINLSFSDNVSIDPYNSFAMPITITGATGSTAAPASAIMNYTLFSEFSSPVLYQINLFPEVEAITPTNYLNDLSTRGINASNIPTTTFVVSKVYSTVTTDVNGNANQIQMIGNPLASNTKNDNVYKLPYYPGNQYFMDYNARFILPGLPLSDFDNTFQATIPYKLHPYVSGMSLSGNQLTVNFSRPVNGSTADLTVDASKCGLPTGQGPFDSGGLSPAFTSNSVSMTFNPYMTIPSSGSSNYATICIGGPGGCGGKASSLESANNFPLLGNSQSTSFSMPDPNNYATNYANKAWVGNSSNFPAVKQTAGDFKMQIPCGATPTYKITAIVSPGTEGSYTWPTGLSGPTISGNTYSWTLNVPSGSTPSFTVTPKGGYGVSSISVGRNNVPITSTPGSAVTVPFSAVMSAQTITASFAPIYTITASVNSSAGGTISPSGATGVFSGGSQIFTVTPNAGYAIGQVLNEAGNKLTLSSSNTYRFTNVIANHAITADFYPIITSYVGVGGTITPLGPTVVPYNASQTFTISPSAGYAISQVTDENSNVLTLSATNTYTFTNVIVPHTITVIFSPTITASAGTGGTISPSGLTVVPFNGSQTFTITPNTNFGIYQISIPTTTPAQTLGPFTSAQTYTFNSVTTPQTISVTFGPIINASAGTGGSISPSGATVAPYGASQAFTFWANSGYSFLGMTINGTATTPTSMGYTFNDVTAPNQTISVSFVPTNSPPASVISITDATFGANCGASDGNVTNKVISTCNSKVSCNFIEGDALFGDPAPNCPKNFSVSYTCTGGGSYTASAPAVPYENQPVSLSCSG